jgi:hypothetical protein
MAIPGNTEILANMAIAANMRTRSIKGTNTRVVGNTKAAETKTRTRKSKSVYLI